MNDWILFLILFILILALLYGVGWVVAHVVVWLTKPKKSLQDVLDGIQAEQVSEALGRKGK